MTFDVLIEIPRGSRNKYEYDFDLKQIRFDRMLHTSMMYPADYGFVPETLALDNDPIDVLVLFTNPVVPGCVAKVRPVGVLNMSDEKGPDEKIICVPLTDPMGDDVHKFSDLNPHKIKEIEHFFRTYKDLENKEVIIGNWGDEQEAKDLVEKAIARYKESDTVTNNFSL
jgi:inorganic pyrophosphatase